MVPPGQRCTVPAKSPRAVERSLGSPFPWEKKGPVSLGTPKSGSCEFPWAQEQYAHGCSLRSGP